LYDSCEKNKGLLNYRLQLGIDGLCGVETGAQGGSEHLPNNIGISTLYWKDLKGHSRYVKSRISNDQMDFGIFE
jgi:hypothetical protein